MTRSSTPTSTRRSCRAAALRRITRAPSFTAADVQTQWSPDGRQLLFVRKWNDGSKQAIYTVDAKGGRIRRVTPFALRAGDWPDWSPDGTRILFRSPETDDFLHSNLYTIRPDGSGLRQVTHAARRDARLLGVVLARRQAHHARARGHRRRGGRLDHAHGRQRPHAGHPHARRATARRTGAGGSAEPGGGRDYALRVRARLAVLAITAALVGGCGARRRRMTRPAARRSRRSCSSGIAFRPTATARRGARC